MKRCCVVVTGFRPRDKGLETSPTRIAVTMRKDESHSGFGTKVGSDR